MTSTDRPGREIPKDYRTIAEDLVTNQGWRYRIGKGHPLLFPADPTWRPIPVPTSPTTNTRGLKNWIGQIRRSGGIIPDPRERR